LSPVQCRCCCFLLALKVAQLTLLLLYALLGFFLALACGGTCLEDTGELGECGDALSKGWNALGSFLMLGKLGLPSLMGLPTHIPLFGRLRRTFRGLVRGFLLACRRVNRRNDRAGANRRGELFRQPADLRLPTDQLLQCLAFDAKLAGFLKN